MFFPKKQLKTKRSGTKEGSSIQMIHPKVHLDELLLRKPRLYEISDEQGKSFDNEEIILWYMIGAPIGGLTPFPRKAVRLNISTHKPNPTHAFISSA